VARLARVVLPGYPHHVTQRGVRAMDIFWSADDRAEYLHHMAEQSRKHGLVCLSWCLMTNHVHLVVVPEKPTSLARGIGEAHRRYARTVNFRQQKRGHLFQERFYSCPLDEQHFIASVRYAERNPVRARMVELPWEYEWSSAAWRTQVSRKYHIGNLSPENPAAGGRTAPTASPAPRGDCWPCPRACCWCRSVCSRPSPWSPDDLHRSCTSRSGRSSRRRRDSGRA